MKKARIARAADFTTCHGALFDKVAWKLRSTAKLEQLARYIEKMPVEECRYWLGQALRDERRARAAFRTLAGL